MNIILKYFIYKMMEYLKSNPVVLQEVREMLNTSSGNVYTTDSVGGSVITTEDVAGSCIWILPEDTSAEVVDEISDFFSSIDDGEKRIIISAGEFTLLRF